MHGEIKSGDVILSFNGQRSWTRGTWREKRRGRRWQRCRARKNYAGTRAHQIVHVTIQEWPEDKAAAPKGDMRKSLGLELASARGAKE